MYIGTLIIGIFALLVSVNSNIPTAGSSNQTDVPVYGEKHAACIAETGIKPSEFESGSHSLSDEHQLDCYAGCVLRKYGAIRDDANTTVTDSPRERNICFNHTDEDDCKTAGKILDCLAEQNIFFPFFVDTRSQEQRDELSNNDEIKWLSSARWQRNGEDASDTASTISPTEVETVVPKIFSGSRLENYILT